MMEEIIKNARELNKKQDRPHSCGFCGKSFVREESVVKHVCEQKRRHDQQDEPGVRLGHQAYVIFCKRNRIQKQSYTEFSSSPYYKAFVKFGRYAVTIRAIAPDSLVKHLLDEKVKIDHWCRDTHYDKFVIQRLKVEPLKEALERTVITMTTWAESHNSTWMHYFTEAAPSRLVYDTCAGRISPWVWYCHKQAKARLGILSEQDLDQMGPYIDPDYWMVMLSREPDNVNYVTELFK